MVVLLLVYVFSVDESEVVTPHQNPQLGKNPKLIKKIKLAEKCMVVLEIGLSYALDIAEFEFVTSQ